MAHIYLLFISLFIYFIFYSLSASENGSENENDTETWSEKSSRILSYFGFKAIPEKNSYFVKEGSTGKFIDSEKNSEKNGEKNGEKNDGKNGEKNGNLGDKKLNSTTLEANSKSSSSSKNSNSNSNNSNNSNNNSNYRYRSPLPMMYKNISNFFGFKNFQNSHEQYELVQSCTDSLSVDTDNDSTLNDDLENEIENLTETEIDSRSQAV